MPNITPCFHPRALGKSLNSRILTFVQSSWLFKNSLWKSDVYFGIIALSYVKDVNIYGNHKMCGMRLQRKRTRGGLHALRIPYIQQPPGQHRLQALHKRRSRRNLIGQSIISQPTYDRPACGQFYRPAPTAPRRRLSKPGARRKRRLGQAIAAIWIC